LASGDVSLCLRLGALSTDQLAATLICALISDMMPRDKKSLKTEGIRELSRWHASGLKVIRTSPEGEER
jgi:hypothetical protein